MEVFEFSTLQVAVRAVQIVVAVVVLAAASTQLSTHFFHIPQSSLV
jgi:hypothetical protein